MKNDKIPMPSTQAVHKATAHRMRFLYPLAAICIAAVFLAPGEGDVQTAHEAGATYHVVVEAS